MKLRAVFLAAALMVVSSSAWAVDAFLDGGKLLSYCQQPDTAVGGIMCVGYISGVADAMSANAADPVLKSVTNPSGNESLMTLKSDRTV